MTVLGPRQAGKTTLVRHLLPGHRYVNLEMPDVRTFAQEDPRGFLAEHASPVILDEIQRVPELLSYVQGLVDESGANGSFVLTGSHQLELRAAISQSLAGRTALLTLYPLSIAELDGAGMVSASMDSTSTCCTDFCHGCTTQHSVRRPPTQTTSAPTSSATYVS